MNILRRAIGSYGGPAAGLLVSEMACRAASFLLFVTLARLTNLSYVGDFALASAIATTAVVLVDLGLNQRVATRSSVHPASAPGYVRQTLRRKIQLFPLLILAAAAAAVALRPSTWREFALLLLLQVIAFFVLEVGGVFDSALRGCGHVKPVAAARWTRAGLLLIGALVLLSTPTTIVAATGFLVAACGDAMLVAASWRRLKPAGMPRPQAADLPSTPGLGPYASLTIGVGLYARLDQLLLGALLPPSALAVYAGAYKFYEVVLLIPQVFARARIASFMRGDWQMATRAAIRSAILCTVVVALLPFYVWVPTTILGEGFGAALPIFAILICSLPGTGASAVLLNRLLADSYTRWVPAYVALAQLAINAVLVVTLVRYVGLNGAAIAVALLELTNPLFYVLTRRSITLVRLRAGVLPESSRQPVS